MIDRIVPPIGLLVPIAVCLILACAASSALSATTTVTVMNVAAPADSTVEVTRYLADWTYQDNVAADASGIVTWTDIPAGAYNLEAYRNGPFGREYWATAMNCQVVEPSTLFTLTRYAPCAQQVVLKDNATGTVIAPGQPVPVGTVVRFEVTVRNGGSYAQDVTVRMIADVDQAAPYDYDTTSARTTIPASSAAPVTFTYATPVAGSFYYALTVGTDIHNNMTYVLTDGWPWALVASTKCDLNATVKNASGARMAGATVARYTNGGAYVDSDVTTSSGIASWSGIDPGTYTLKVSYNGDYWTSGSVTVTTGLSTVTLQRNEPYANGFKVRKAATNEEITGQTAVPGTPLKYEVSVRNGTSAARTITAKLWIDQDKASPYDFYQASSPRSISSGATYTFTFYHTPSAGVYNCQIETDTDIGGSIRTDFWPWGGAVTVRDVPTLAKEFFDDFSYTGPTDPDFLASAWHVRTVNPEFPGPTGSQWKSDCVRFGPDPQGGANKLMTLVCTSQGPAAPPEQAEVSTNARFLEGTYAARVRLTDAAVSGPNDDQIVEAFYAINAQRYDLDPDYSECDFEYLPNGGWDIVGKRMWYMTWESFRLDPWQAVKLTSYQNQSYAGWHTLLFQVSGGQVKYYIDGSLKATHTGTSCPGNCYPEGLMSIQLQLWFVITGGIGSSTTPREYNMDVDWVYHGKNTALSGPEVEAIVSRMRSDGLVRKDTMDPVTPPAQGRIASYSYTAYDETTPGSGVRPLDGQIRFYDLATGTSFTRAAIAQNVIHAMKPKFSADGHSVVFEGLPAGRSYDSSWQNSLDIFLYDFATDSLTNLSAAAQLGSSIDEDPDFSPDGDRIVFVRDRSDISAMDLSTYAVIPLTTDGATTVESCPGYSPNGQWVAYCAGTGATADLIRVPSSGGTPQTVFGNASIADVSPSYIDGNHLLFTRWARFDEFEHDIYLYDFPAGVQRWLPFSAWRSANEYDPFPLSGDLVGFSSDRGGKGGSDLFIGDTANGASLWLANASTDKQDLGGSFTPYVVNPPAFSIMTSSLPAGKAAVPYSQTLSCAGGVLPYAWTLASGSLPAGLSLDSSTGLISGLPQAHGVAQFTIGVADSQTPAATATAALSIFVAPPDLVISTQSLSGGVVGAAYSQLLAAEGGISPYTWSLSSGALPNGLSLSPATGVISGVPQAYGTAQFTVALTDSQAPSATATAALSIAVSPSGLAITTQALAGGTVGGAYSQPLAANGGVSPYAWSIASGSLPLGLSLNASTGAISGTPQSSGTAQFTVGLADAQTPSATATAALSIAVSPLPLTIITQSLPGGTSGIAYSQTLTAAGGVSPYGWSIAAGSLPAGLSLGASTGVISGTPQSSGTAQFTIGLADSQAPAATATVALSIVVAPPALTISTQSLAAGMVGTAYSQSLAATGGVSPYAWSLASGSLPLGLSLNGSTGAISGMPQSSGAAQFTIRVGDSQTPSATATAALSIVISPASLAITTQSLAGGTSGVPYSQTLGATGGLSPYSWSIASGSLPAGLSLGASTGVISGTPQSSAASQFAVRVADSQAPSATAIAALSISVAPPALAISTQSLAGGTVGTAYSQSLAATGGVPPYAWSLASGALPAGLSLDSSTGLISGLPQSYGAAQFTIRVADSQAPSAAATAALSIAVNPSGLAITTQSLAGGTVASAYSQPLAATGGVPPYGWSVAGGSLPAGLSLGASTGLISGTPQAAGTAQFTIGLADSQAPAATATAALSITISPLALAITTQSLPGGTVGATYSQTLAATGGVPPYSWSISAGSLPGNLTLDSSSGLISGQAAASGTFSFTARVGDSGGHSSSRDFSITVAGNVPRVTSPNGGESWKPGSFHTINWTPGAGDGLTIELYKGGAKIQDLAAGIADTGNRTWLIPKDVPAGSDYTIKIYITSDPTVCDYSDGPFTIGPFVALTAPDGGEKCIAGDTAAILWTTNAEGSVKIELLKNGALNGTITAATPCAAGRYDWTIPADQVPGTDYKVRITYDSGTYDLSSGNFEIVYDHNTAQVLSGTLVGQTLTAANPTITVSPGAAIQGTVSLMVHNIFSSPTPMVPAAQATSWGDASAEYSVIYATAPAGDTTVNVPVSLVAPATAGVYYILYPFAACGDAEHLLSGTHPDYPADWTNGNKVAMRPAADFEQAITAGWIPFDWYSPSGPARGTIAMGAVRVKVVPSTVKLVSGKVAGQSVSPSAPAVFVTPGAALQGSFTVKAHNVNPSGVTVPVAFTYTWGEPQVSYATLSSGVRAGDTTLTVNVNTTAPTTPGTYYVAVALTTGGDAAQLMSGTHPSYTADWTNGNKVALRPAADFELGMAQGWAPYDWYTPAGPAHGHIGLTALRVVVGAQPIAVTAPGDGAVWLKGISYPITWQSDLGGNVKIEVVKDGAVVSTISSNTANDGYYSWSVPVTVPAATGYKIRITSKASSWLYGESEGSLTIPPFISVTAPNGGEVWTRGATMNVTWGANTTGPVRIELYKSGSLYSTIAEAAAGTGTFAWTIPTSLPAAGGYKVKITYDTTSDFSNSSFTLK